MPPVTPRGFARNPAQGPAIHKAPIGHLANFTLTGTNRVSPISAPAQSSDYQQDGEFITVAIPANGNVRIQRAGNQWVLYQGPAEANVRIVGGAFSTFPLLTGAGPYNKPFPGIEVQDILGVATTATFWVGFVPLINFQIVQGGTPPSPSGIVTVHQALVAGTGAPKQVVTTSTPFTKAWFYGIQSFTAGIPTNNASNAYVGKSSTQLSDLLFPGQSESISGSNGQVLDLAQIWFQAAIGDSIFYTYT